MRLRKIVSMVCLAVLLSFTVACGGKGSEYVGKWVPKDSADAKKAIDISRNGASFIVTTPDGDKSAVEYDKDSQTLKQGIFVITYVKATDTLLVPGGDEYKRLK